MLADIKLVLGFRIPSGTFYQTVNVAASVVTAPITLHLYYNYGEDVPHMTSTSLVFCSCVLFVYEKLHNVEALSYRYRNMPINGEAQIYIERIAQCLICDWL